MKKILRQGSINRYTKYRAKCTTCDTEFEYEKEDIHVLKGFSITVTCPQCGNEVYHKGNPASRITTEKL